LNLQHGNYHIKCGISLYSESTDVADWEFIDVIPNAYAFSMAPKSNGMLGGLVVWDNQLSLSRVESL